MPNLKNIKAPYSKTVVLRASRQQNAQEATPKQLVLIYK